MPIWLRKFTFHKIKEWYEKQQSSNQDDVVEQSIKTLKSAQSAAPIKPPTYITKASKK
jgi:hypothetical protein